MKSMQLKEIFDKIEAALPEIKTQYHVESIGIFGSLARDETITSSDIDLLVEMDPLYTFDRYINAKFYLEDLLGCQVDLVMNETLRERIRPQVERDAIRVT